MPRRAQEIRGPAVVGDDREELYSESRLWMALENSSRENYELELAYRCLSIIGKKGFASDLSWVWHYLSSLQNYDRAGRETDMRWRGNQSHDCSHQVWNVKNQVSTEQGS